MSRIPRSFIQSFIAQSAEEKRNQMLDLWKIVWGIRLFNKHIEKGGAGIENYTSIVIEELKKIQSICEQEIQVVDPIIAKLQHYLLSTKFSETWTRMRYELIYASQFQLYLKSIARASSSLLTRSFELNDIQQTLLSDVKKVVEQSSSVAKSTIYPMFMLLSDNWIEFDTIHIRIKELKQLIDILISFKINNYSEIDNSVSNEEADVFAHSLEQADVIGQVIDVVPASKELSLKGYCPVALRENYSLPVQGDRKNALAQCAESYYCCFNQNALHAFCKNPYYYINSAVHSVRMNPELFLLLEIQEQLLPSAILSQNIHANSCDGGTQTEDVLEPNIDPQYEFSEWKLRQRAIKYANLRTKKTHSTQTQLSHFKRESETQVYLPKTKSTNTTKDAGTNPQKTVRYVEGLRGNNKTKMKVVSLTFDQ